MSNYYRNDSNRFVYGKLNSFISFRYGYGFLKEKFRKIDRGGVAIRYFYNGGISLGVLKPIYYEIIYAYNTEFEKFDINRHGVQDILGKASFFKGLEEASITPGGFLKFGLSFEYSKKDRQVRAVEAGFSLEGFAKKMAVMANEKDKQLYFSIFLSYRFGRIVSSGHLSDVDGKIIEQTNE